MKSVLSRMIQSLIFILVTAWILLSLLLYFFQPKFVYMPFQELAATPVNKNLPYEDVFLDTSDNVKIHGWFVPHENPRATLLFLHGNGGNISHRLEKLSIYNQLGLSILIIDYRGYGLSEGNISEQGTYLDAETAWTYLTQEKNIPGNRIIIYGESLGGAIASWLASHVTAGALVIESSFTSIADMGKYYYPYLPVKLLTRIKYPSIEYIGNVQYPILIIHSPQDDIVPYTQGVELYEAANEPKSFLEIAGDHNGGFYTSGELYSKGLDQFILTHFDWPLEH